MALPVGISTCTITAGSSLDFDGTDYVTTVEVEPTLGGAASKKAAIVWEATGQPLINFTDKYTSTEGMPVTFALPHVDQAGFVNAAGEAFTMWSYRAVITVQGGDRTTYRVTKNFQVLVGQTSVDLDLVPDGSITAPTSAPLPPVLSVNGQTGTVTIDPGEAADEAVAQRISEGVLTKIALGEEIATTGTPAEVAVAAKIAAAKVPDTVITYDVDGNVETVTENGLTTTYTYNVDGSVATDSVTIGGDTITRSYSYDADGNLTEIEAA